jgi:hypothetical protein
MRVIPWPPVEADYDGAPDGERIYQGGDVGADGCSGTTASATVATSWRRDSPDFRNGSPLARQATAQLPRCCASTLRRRNGHSRRHGLSSARAVPEKLADGFGIACGYSMPRPCLLG